MRNRRMLWTLCAAGILAAAVLMTGANDLTAAGRDGGMDTGDSGSASGDAKTVLITGANRGLGLEFARQYNSAGWNVIATARRPETATELQSLDVRVVQLDVTDQADIDRLVGQLDGVAVDLLINNAGIFPRAGTLAETDFDDVLRTYEVNTIGPMRVTRALLPNLRAGGSKMIVSISSGLGSIEDNSNGRFYGYRESKAALNMFTRSLASELGSEGFTCVVISPGWVQTDMGGPNASLTPEVSIAGMRKVIAGLSTADSGTYWNYDGSAVPW